MPGRRRLPGGGWRRRAALAAPAARVRRAASEAAVAAVALMSAPAGPVRYGAWSKDKQGWFLGLGGGAWITILLGGAAAADRRGRARSGCSRWRWTPVVGGADRARRRPCPGPLGVPLGARFPSSMRRSCHALDRLAVQGCRRHRREVRRGRPARRAVRASAPTTDRRSGRCWPARRSSPTTGNAPGRSSPGSPIPASGWPRCPPGPGWATACPSCSKAPRPPSWCR